MDEDEYREDQPIGDDPALAFEKLRGEVSLLRSAIEGLTAAREAIDIPDYEPTLERTEKVLGILVQQIDAMRKSPAMTLTPENMGGRLNASVMETLNTLRNHTQASKSAVDGVMGDLRGLVLSARRADEQNRWLYMIGIGGVLLGLLLYAALAGPVARLMPVSWQWPERVAARVLAEPTQWEAGQHLMQRAAPASWAMIVAANPLAEGNREALQACREAAKKGKKAVRCTIEVKIGE
ncbi:MULTISPECIES: DUF6118 family protein [Sphingomonadales]|jgi:hypothetical protein|uniref:Uncharacterized protein n=2 Tax=Sphingomonadales TaxID=204457 RepID=A0A4R6FAD0_9SPHN|nr:MULTISPECIES: DUF6118 family protein [Sphingomonadales]RKF17364.1 hypothetical protein D6851_16800 [Altericroceibacterium spongiae]TDN77993.1 hypothetical protein EV664_12125 [Stakelama pacifica]GGP00529.1 hypothetical protein GCM10011329_36620 [Stakelama pacifica]